MFGVGEVGGANQYGPYDSGLGSFETTIDKLFQLLNSMVEAQAEISQKVFDQLKKAEKEMQEFDKLMAKKKGPKLRQKLAQMTAKLNNLQMQLIESGKLDNISGKNLMKRLETLQGRLEELQRKHASADQGGIILGEGEDTHPLV
ncbi:MAG: hypothetical protein KKA31_05515 [Candidatus Margulisbacteria bacterium]|nr:hypothetical protein [Candidatus Margulisiibacteriota bacterium]